MDDMKPQDHANQEDEALADALHLVLRDDASTTVPANVEAAVMRAWDARAQRPTAGHRFRARGWVLPSLATACAALVAVLWVQRAIGSKPTPPEPTAAASSLESLAFDERYSLDLIGAPAVLVQEDTAWLQRVRLSVEPSVLAAFGYAVADPWNTQPFDVEVLIGLDGVPRAIRRLEGNHPGSTP